jgi:GT2 family glycosyltransferase
MVRNKKDLSVGLIILDFLKADRVLRNVKLLQKQKLDLDLHIIVADNSCNSANAKKLLKLQKYPRVKVIIFDQNLGYIKAHNQALKGSKFDYYLIVNPDIIIRDQTLIRNMVNYMQQNPDIGILGPKQINDDGSIAMTVRGWPNLFLQVCRRSLLRKLPLIKTWVLRDEMAHLDYDKIQDVPWLQSSFNVVRGDFFRKVGGLCESYFLFMSDPELCWQAWKSKLRVVYYPKVQVYADGVRLSAGGFISFFQKWVMRQHLLDSLRFLSKHLFEKKPF